MRMVMLAVSLWLATSPLWGKIVFSSKRDGNLEIYTMDSDGTNQMRLTFNEVTDAAPAWSPNGQQIVFYSYRDNNKNAHTGVNVEIYVMDADGGNQRRLTHCLGIDAFPHWSPDRNQIAFDSTRNGGKNQDLNIFVMDTDGDNIRQITNVWFASRPRWSPNGKQIAYEGFIGDNREILVINADGTGRFKVSQPRQDTDMFLGGWSPDGKQIVYKETVDLNLENSFVVIAMLDPIGRRRVKQRERVPAPRMPLRSVSFSADGKSILFSGKWNNQWDIYRFRLADHALIQLTDNPGTDGAPQEWNPRLSVRLQRLLPLFWGEIKSDLLQH